MPHCPDSPTLRRGDEPTTKHPGATSPMGAANHLHHQHWAPVPQSRPGSLPDAATTKHAGGIRQPPASPSASRVVTRISRATCRRHTCQTPPSRAIRHRRPRRRRHRPDPAATGRNQPRGSQIRRRRRRIRSHAPHRRTAFPARRVASSCRRQAVAGVVAPPLPSRRAAQFPAARSGGGEAGERRRGWRRPSVRVSPPVARAWTIGGCPLLHLLSIYHLSFQMDIKMPLARVRTCCACNKEF